uniref:SH2 domain-containing protein n=1 Tax=Acrobeloides nanus TaxID=290746 RepID=A0A914D547_9BILA
MSRSRFEQIAEYLEDMSWFHGIVRREMAESLIIKEGEFLVRQSATFPGQIILTLMDSEDFPQHICLVDLDARIKTSENEFNSIVQLIKYHLTNNIPLVYGDVVLYIRKPVCRPGSTPSSETPTPLGMKRFY